MKENIKILIVDDDSHILHALEEILTIQGYSVFTAGNGAEGIKKISLTKPDLIITDINMPDMEGMEFLRMLKVKKYSTPIIVMSGEAVGMKFMESARILGAAGTLKKPFSQYDYHILILHHWMKFLILIFLFHWKPRILEVET